MWQMCAGSGSWALREGGRVRRRGGGGRGRGVRALLGAGVWCAIAVGLVTVSAAAARAQCLGVMAVWSPPVPAHAAAALRTARGCGC